MPNGGTLDQVQEYIQQDDALLNQENPVSGQKYTVLDTQRKAKIYSIILYIEWSGQPTPLECHITIDGKSYTITQNNPASATTYCVNRSATATARPFAIGTTDYSRERSHLQKGDVKIEAEITGGTVTLLLCRVKWAKKFGA